MRITSTTRAGPFFKLRFELVAPPGTFWRARDVNGRFMDKLDPICGRSRPLVAGCHGQRRNTRPYGRQGV